MTETIIWLAPFVFLLAGTVKGAIGIGLPTTVIAFLSQFVDPRVAVALGVTPMIASNLWQVHREAGFARTARRFWPFAAALFVTLLAVVTVWAAEAEGATLLLATGISIAIFAGVSLIGSPPALAPRLERPAQIAAGGAAGVMGGLTGLWSPPLLVLLLSLRLPKSEFVGSVGLLLLVGAAPLLVGYVLNGLMTWEIFAWSVAMVAPTFLGFSIGERLRRRLDQERFQKAVLLFFLIMGLNLIRRSFFG